MESEDVLLIGGLAVGGLLLWKSGILGGVSDATSGLGQGIGQIGTSTGDAYASAAGFFGQAFKDLTAIISPQTYAPSTNNAYNRSPNVPPPTQPTDYSVQTVLRGGGIGTVNFTTSVPVFPTAQTQIAQIMAQGQPTLLHNAVAPVSQPTTQFTSAQTNALINRPPPVVNLNVLQRGFR